MKKIINCAIWILICCVFTACDKEEQINPTMTEMTTELIVETDTETDTVQDTQPATEAEAEEILPEPADGDFVKITDYISDIEVELMYATDNNFTGQRIYDFDEAYLCYGTVKKLAKVQAELKELGFRLKIWDAYRPYEAQVRLWEVYPNPTYVANPSKGATGHCTGRTIDVTLVTQDGKEVVMPTAFDEFSALADRDYSDCDSEAVQNVLVLENVMISNGFTPYKGEWWDYTDSESYGEVEAFVPPFSKKFEENNVYDSVGELKVAQDTSQLIIVSVSETGTELSMHVKDSVGQWKEILKTSTIIGKQGVGQASESKMITPAGVYGFCNAFGIKNNPGTRFDYTKVDESYYWVDDPESSYYNKFVTVKETSTQWNSAEHIVSVGTPYNYVLALDYNSECVPYAGSAIFLHVAEGTYTAGCIAVSEEMMIKILNNIHTDCKIVIDKAENIFLY